MIVRLSFSFSLRAESAPQVHGHIASDQLKSPPSIDLFLSLALLFYVMTLQLGAIAQYR